MRQVVGKYERILEFMEAYDKRHPDPKKNYGIHGVSMRFVLKGEKGAVQFLLYTNWQLKYVQEEMDQQPASDPRFTHTLCHPMPADLGYHSPVPTYEGHTPMRKSCEWMEGKPCYYDGSTLNAEPVYEGFVAHGEEWLWKELERYYEETFEGAKVVEEL